MIPMLGEPFGAQVHQLLIHLVNIIHSISPEQNEDQQYISILNMLTILQDTFNQHIFICSTVGWIQLSPFLHLLEPPKIQSVVTPLLYHKQAYRKILLN